MLKHPLILLAATLTLPAQGALVAYWNFNSLAITAASAPGSGGVPTAIGADQGTGTVGLDNWGGLVDDFAGSTSNALGGDLAEESLSLISGGPTAGPFPGNGSFITLSFQMTGYADPVVTFATRGTATGFDTGTWSWSVDGTNFTTLEGVNTATRNTTFGLAAVDLGATDDLDEAPTVTLRYTLSGAASNSGNNRIDNIQINATPIPEPSLGLLGGLGLLSLLRRRR